MAERIHEHVEVVVGQPVERSRRITHHVEEALCRRIEEPELVAGNVARDAVEGRGQRTAEIGVELGFGHTRFLEVEDVQEAVAERGRASARSASPRGVGTGATPEKWTSQRRDGVKAVGP